MAIHTDETLLKQTGARIRLLRKERNMSLRDLAYSIGMESSNLSVIENGKSNPQLLTYARIAAALHVTLKDLFNFDFDYQAFFEGSGEYTPRKHK